MNKNTARTDLALENAESIGSSAKGIVIYEDIKEDVKITRIKITSEDGEKEIGKPKGTYINLEVPRFTAGAGLDKNIAKLLSYELNTLLPENRSCVLVVGLGNTEITPDALGPKAAYKVLATRHISKELALKLGLSDIKSVAVITPGVLGKTGIETKELIKSAADSILPSAIIIIDALAARSLNRLGCTVQISNSGINPGSGVGNSRAEISKKSLGIPVVSIGVPTVVDAKTLISDITNNNEADCPDMIVTPKEIDMMINRASELIAAAINLCLQPDLSLEDLAGLI